MSVRSFTLVFGIVFLLVGICGFIPAFLTQPAAHHDEAVTVNAFEGYLFGLFHVNVLHSLVHVLFGIMDSRCRVGSTAPACTPASSRSATPSWR